jgi:hypothetical protein
MAYKQAQNRKKHLLKTYKATKNSWGSGVWFDEQTGRYVKYSGSNTPGYTKYLRRMSNRKVRRAKDIGNHSNYKKYYDYWWILF